MIQWDKTMVQPGADIETIADFFRDLCRHCEKEGKQAAHEVIRSRITERHLQEGLCLAADGNHPSIVGRYLRETLPHNWHPDLVQHLASAVEIWQSGGPLHEVLGCFSVPVSDR